MRREVGGDLDVQFVEDRAGDEGQVEVARFLEANPGQLGELAILPDPGRFLRRDGAAVDGEEPGVEAPHALGRGDGAGDEMQRLEIGQHAVAVERLPAGGHGLGRAVLGGAEQEAGLLVGLADRGERQRPAEVVRRTAEPPGQGRLGIVRQGVRHRHRPITEFDPPAGKHELARHEGEARVAAAHQHLRTATSAPVQDDHGRGVPGTEAGGRTCRVRCGLRGHRVRLGQG